MGTYDREVLVLLTYVVDSHRMFLSSHPLHFCKGTTFFRDYQIF